MSNDNKSANKNDRSKPGTIDRNRGNDTARKTGDESQDALRHQEDALHHHKDKGSKQDSPDIKGGQSK